MSYFRPSIDAMTGYVPGEQPPAGQKVIKLNTNENPFAPSPKAMEVLRHLDGEQLRRYPDPASGNVRHAVSQVFNVPPEWVLVGNGSDELLAMLIKACCQQGRPAVYPMPTYVYYRTLAQVQDAPFIEVPYDDEYNLPVDELVRQDGAVTFIANPNSPSGTFTSTDVLERLAVKLRGLLVVDEAYADFAEDHATRLVAKRSNVVILRTLSKGYSLAGLRVGFAILQPSLVPALVKVKDHYNVSASSAAAAAAAILDQTYMRANADAIKAQRRQLTDSLRGLGFRVWPSQSNFLLARPPAGDAEATYQALKARGILVRYFKEPRLEDKLRITVGSPADNAALVSALQETLGKKA